MLTMRSAGFIAGWLANRDAISDCGLIFALDEILHDLGDSSLWLSGRGLYEQLAAAPCSLSGAGTYLRDVSAVVSIIDSPPPTHHFVER